MKDAASMNIDIASMDRYIDAIQVIDDINTLQVSKCRTLTVERVSTVGFTLTADKYESVGSFTTTLHISYPAGANQTVSIVDVRTIGSDTCVRDVILDSTGNVNVADYNVSETHMIYAMMKNVIVGGTSIECCTIFDYTNCPTSNYVYFRVTDIGDIQFLSNPSGAHIWLAPTGQTPSDTTKITPDTIADLPIGNYDYILKLTNYNDYIGPVPVEVIKNQTAIVGPISLIPAEGCIYFTSSPQGAHIYLAPIGQTPIDTGLVTPNIVCGKPLGDYIYRLTLSGYEDSTGTVTLVSGHGEIITKTLRGLPVLSDIIISPQNPSVAVGTDQQFSATTIDQYGDPIAATVAWSSSNTYVGIIDPNTGMFSALHTGTTVITATSASISKTTAATVTAVVPALRTITVSPATISIAVGNATVFTATTLDQFGNPISAIATWSSSSPNIGTIDQNGVFVALSVGSTVISATSGSITGIAVANVTSGPPGGIEAGLFGNINTAALIIGTAMIGAVLISKQPKFEFIESKKIPERITYPTKE